MALEVRRQPKETNQSLTYRFSKRIRGSGILLRARKSRFRERPKSRRAKKEAALRREELRRRYEKLKKLGKIEK